MAEEWRAVLGYEGLYEVAQIKDGIRIAIFPSTISASHIADPGHIGACASGRRKTAGGYAWEYV